LRENRLGDGTQTTHLGILELAWAAAVRRPPMTKWTVLVFMAPDERLQAAARADLLEMQTAGIHEIDLAVQIDFPGQTERHVFEDGRPRDVARLPPAATMVESMTAFLTWAKHRPANGPLALILWGHGQGAGTKLSLPGALDAQASPTARRNGRAQAAALETFAFQRLPAFGGRYSKAAKVKAPEALVAAGNAGVKSLDVRQLGGVIRSIYPDRQIALLGFDACFMAGIEVALEVHDVAQLLVASQDFVPDEGWDYRRVLEIVSLVGRPDPRRIGEAIVGHVRDVGGLTNLSLLNLEVADARLRDRLNRLADALIAYLAVHPDAALRVQAIFRDARYLRVRQFIDLKDACERLRNDFAESPTDPRAADVCRAAESMLEWHAAFVLRHEAEGLAKKLNGVSIFYKHVHAGFQLPDDPCPREMDVSIDPPNPQQQELESATKWEVLLERLAPGAGHVGLPLELAASA
jgi:hypothetical protein